MSLALSVSSGCCYPSGWFAMSRQEPCRYFLRGSCRFGNNCRWLHVSTNEYQNHTQINPFGFGASQFSQRQQPQKPNPFDLGEKNKNSTSQFQALSKETFSNSVGQPFANKWIRSTATASKLTDSQTPGSSHICTDPESCQNIIADYFKNAMPCDLSFEELRAMAYEEAKQGCTLDYIVERERNLLQSKISEFDNTPNQGKKVPKKVNEVKSMVDTAVMVMPKFDLGMENPLKTGGFCGPCYAAPAFTSFSQLGSLANVTSAFRDKQDYKEDSKERNLMQSELSEFDNDKALPTPLSYAVSDNTPDQGKNAPKANRVRIKIADTALMNIDKFDLGTGSPLKTGGSCGQCDAAPAFTSFSQLGSVANATSAFWEKQEDSKEDGIWLKENWSIGEIPFDQMSLDVQYQHQRRTFSLKPKGNRRDFSLGYIYTF